MSWGVINGTIQFIDGFDIGPDGYWRPLKCQRCNGTKVVSRVANQHDPRECGYDHWSEPCGRCRPSVDDISGWLRVSSVIVS